MHALESGYFTILIDLHDHLQTLAGKAKNKKKRNLKLHRRYLHMCISYSNCTHN